MQAEEQAKLKATRDPAKLVNTESRRILERAENEMLLNAFGVMVCHGNHHHDQEWLACNGTIDLTEDVETAEAKWCDISPASLQQIVSTTLKALRSDYERVSIHYTLLVVVCAPRKQGRFVDDLLRWCLVLCSFPTTR